MYILFDYLKFNSVIFPINAAILNCKESCDRVGEFTEGVTVRDSVRTTHYNTLLPVS